MAVININRNQFEEMVHSGKTVLVEFSAPWCVYCRRLAPALESVAEEYKDIITMINKLRFCEEDILGQTIQKLEFAAAAYKRNNRAASQLSQSIAELNAKLLALERLRSKGYLAADIYHTQAREIRQQLGKLKTERYSSFESRITTMLEDVRKLKSLIDELEQPLEVFDEKLFHEVVTDICINNRDEMTVTLLGGLKFTEQI